jgi:hypothetical protein
LYEAATGSHARLAFAGVLLDYLARILVVSQTSKLRMAQMVDLRFILHVLMALAAKRETIGLLNLESA